VIEGLRDAFAPQAALNYGGIPTGEKRQAEVDRFQKDPACRLFIGSVVTAEGYTLTAASDVIFAELDWRPGKVSQSEDRAHRYGQKNSVLVQHLVLEGSLDAKIAKAIVAKQRVIEEAMDDPEAELEQFTGQVDAIDPFALHW
jgi:SWI/SNF-related matrix-associated actin-dependent regulator 1 of chromatin subfamily A